MTAEREKRVARLCEVDELGELESLVAAGGRHGSRQVEVARYLGYQCRVAVVLAVPAPYITPQHPVAHL